MGNVVDIFYNSAQWLINNSVAIWEFLTTEIPLIGGATITPLTVLTFAGLASLLTVAIVDFIAGGA